MICSRRRDNPPHEESNLDRAHKFHCAHGCGAAQNAGLIDSSGVRIQPDCSPGRCRWLGGELNLDISFSAGNTISYLVMFDIAESLS
jgi:hypothetical protein